MHGARTSESADPLAELQTGGGRDFFAVFTRRLSSRRLARYDRRIIGRCGSEL